MSRRALLILAAASLLPACQSGGAGSPHFSAWGAQGLRDGDFIRPRAIGVKDGEVYVIDTTGRMQVFDLTGSFARSWTIPDGKNGTPTGIAFGRNGNVLIPDTHNSRILEYTRKGEPVDSWGSYGTGDHEFIYPTGIAQGRDGRYYISEYGMAAERVRIFDGNKRLVRQWGEHGDAAGQFNRAMAIALDETAGIYVVDTANHRVQRFDLEGRLISVIGGVGARPGKLKFPEDIALAADGTIFLSEYGTHRVSRFTGDGRFMACYGGPGRKVGQFNGPRGIAVSDTGVVFVADTDNHRIQWFQPGPQA